MAKKKGKTKSIKGVKASSWSAGYKSCYHTHPPLKVVIPPEKLKNGQKDEMITYLYGGNCATPIVKDATIYVGLDYSMADYPSMYPWNDGPIAVFFKIQDMSTPKDPDEFKKMIKWLADKVLEGEKVHVGCIGGHGRTGMVLSALVYELTGNNDAIAYVREHYCEKAVETDTQINFLHKHFGLKKVKAVKAGFGFYGGYAGNGATVNGGVDANSYYSVKSKGSLWGELVDRIKVLKDDGDII